MVTVPVPSSIAPHKSVSSNSLSTHSPKNVRVPSLPLMSPTASAGLPPLVIPPQNSLASTTLPHQSQSQPTTPTSAGIGPMRRRVSDKCNLPISAGMCSCAYINVLNRFEIKLGFYYSLGVIYNAFHFS